MSNSLKQLKKDSSPQSEFKKSLWVRLDLEFDMLNPQSAMTWRQVLAVPLVVFLLFMTTGTGVYAYSSSNVVDGDKLFTVKRGIEVAEKVLYRSPESKAIYRAKMMERRIDEGEILILRLQISPAQAERLQRQFEDFEGKNHLSSDRREFVRNKMINLRVHITESDLTEDEKRAILQAIIIDQLTK